jgi:hypothetical protein
MMSSFDDCLEEATGSGRLWENRAREPRYE